jgi:pimeloyl-ACP methyl ester carboxylesterase
MLCIILIGACKTETHTLQPSDTSQVQLPDNRILSYVEYGPADGTPVLYFHGFPGSHKDIYLFNGPQLAEKYQIRLISIDRPGYGNCDPLPDRKLSEWPEDINHLCSSLGLESFSILAYSGGGPFALACAHARLEGLDKVMVVSGMGPYKAPESKKGSAMLIPKAPRLILKGMNKMVVEKPEKLEANMRKGFPAVDNAILEREEVKMAMNQTLAEAFSSGYQGALDDARIYRSDWGFEISEIDKQVILWHGDQDKNVPIETVRYVADQLPNSSSEFKSAEGHLSLIYKHASDIFHQLSER